MMKVRACIHGDFGRQRVIGPGNAWVVESKTAKVSVQLSSGGKRWTSLRGRPTVVARGRVVLVDEDRVSVRSDDGDEELLCLWKRDKTTEDETGEQPRVTKRCNECRDELPEGVAQSMCGPCIARLDDALRRTPFDDPNAKRPEQPWGISRPAIEAEIVDPVTETMELWQSRRTAMVVAPKPGKKRNARTLLGGVLGAAVGYAMGSMLFKDEDAKPDEGIGDFLSGLAEALFGQISKSQGEKDAKEYAKRNAAEHGATYTPPDEKDDPTEGFVEAAQHVNTRLGDLERGQADVHEKLDRILEKLNPVVDVGEHTFTRRIELEPNDCVHRANVHPDFVREILPKAIAIKVEDGDAKKIFLQRLENMGCGLVSDGETPVSLLERPTKLHLGGPIDHSHELNLYMINRGSERAVVHVTIYGDVPERDPCGNPLPYGSRRF